MVIEECQRFLYRGEEVGIGSIHGIGLFYESSSFVYFKLDRRIGTTEENFRVNMNDKGLE